MRRHISLPPHDGKESFQTEPTLFCVQNTTRRASGSQKPTAMREQKNSLAIMKVRSANCTKDSKGRTVRMGLNDIHSLSHTKWNCK